MAYFYTGIGEKCLVDILKELNLLASMYSTSRLYLKPSHLYSLLMFSVFNKRNSTCLSKWIIKSQLIAVSIKKISSFSFMKLWSNYFRFYWGSKIRVVYMISNIRIFGISVSIYCCTEKYFDLFFILSYLTDVWVHTMCRTLYSRYIWRCKDKILYSRGFCLS